MAEEPRDFQIPQSLILQLANAPTPIFFTSYSLDALPQLNGSLSYITTSEALERVSYMILLRDRNQLIWVDRTISD